MSHVLARRASYHLKAVIDFEESEDSDLHLAS